MEERFCKLVEWTGDMIDRGEAESFDIKYFEKFKKYILNWHEVQLAIYEENKEGVSYRWDRVRFVEGV